MHGSVARQSKLLSLSKNGKVQYFSGSLVGTAKPPSHLLVYIAIFCTFISLTDEQPCHSKVQYVFLKESPLIL